MFPRRLPWHLLCYSAAVRRSYCRPIIFLTYCLRSTRPLIVRPLMSIGRRPIAIWFLFVFFLWAVGKDFQLMITHKQSVDYFIFETHGLLQLFFVFLTATFLLDFAASYYLLRPPKAGFWVCLAAIALGLVNIATALYLALSIIP